MTQTIHIGSLSITLIQANKRPWRVPKDSLALPASEQELEATFLAIDEQTKTIKSLSNAVYAVKREAALAKKKLMG